MRQLESSNTTNLGAFRKQSFMLVMLHFEDFYIVATKAYDLIKNKLLHSYHLKEYNPRVGYHPEGYINFVKKKQILTGYTHIPLHVEDYFKNMEDQEVEKFAKKYIQE